MPFFLPLISDHPKNGPSPLRFLCLIDSGQSSGLRAVAVEFSGRINIDQISTYKAVERATGGSALAAVGAALDEVGAMDGEGGAELWTGLGGASTWIGREAAVLDGARVLPVTGRGGTSADEEEGVGVRGVECTMECGPGRFADSRRSTRLVGAWRAWA